MSKIKLELTLGQIIAILEEMPGSDYRGFVTLARSIEKQVLPQVFGTEYYDKWMLVRKIQTTGSRKLSTVYSDYIEAR